MNCHEIFPQVRDLKNGEFLPANKHGEICVSGPGVMMGYLNNKEATDAMIDANGWLATGDIGYYDSNGYFYIVDRLKELIKYKGFQVILKCAIYVPIHACYSPGFAF
jgi:long-subunit acyl-CoA synthetase (AMP-forming)